MLTPGRALSLNAEAGKPLPKVPGLQPLYDWGCTPRHGEVIMVAGRSGSQKSGFALWYADELALPTLYFSADMSAFTASSRIASKRSGLTTEEVEHAMRHDRKRRQWLMEQMSDSKITFSFGSPITWRQVDEELAAYVELWNQYPEVIVLDNLMDFENTESDYTEQMAVMSGVTEMARDTGAATLVLHHATDKSQNAMHNPGLPPPRGEIKNGLSEKPELTLGVALEPETLAFRIAVLKQRMGPQDPSATTFARIQCYPELTRFDAKGGATYRAA